MSETVERWLDSTLQSVDSAEELTTGVAQRAGFDEDDVMKIGLAVRESMVNAVVHGNRYSAHKKVRLAVTHNGSRLTVRIADQGRASMSITCRTRWRRTTCCAPRGAAFFLSGRLWMRYRSGAWKWAGSK